jgi:uncharacterized damage-inducible protein DinB
MKEIFQQYAAYNMWANNRITERIKQLSDEQVNQHIESSFPSLYKTVWHMWRAEDIWWQRFKLSEKIIPVADNFTGSFAEMCRHFAKQSAQWKEWVDAATDNQLTHVFSFVREKEEYKIKVTDMLLHLFNHATFHRGQLITQLRQLGITDKIPAADFALYVWGKTKW